jgi:micrococcal nuclease
MVDYRETSMKAKGMKGMKTVTVLLLFLVGVLVGLLFIVPATSPQDSRGPLAVKKVIDGDTIVLADGRRVRYIGINTPERGEPFWKEARDYNDLKVGGQLVTLEWGKIREDHYGRTLAYVFVGGNMVNAELLQAGWAHLFVLEPITYYAHFRRLQEEARMRRLGIWGRGGLTGPLKITTLHGNAQGDDRYNLNGEYVRLCNISPRNVNIRGFTLADLAGHTYSFPEVILRPGYTILLFSGKGYDITEGALQLRLYWGSRYPIWNNDGDTAFLRDPQGKLINTVDY